MTPSGTRESIAPRPASGPALDCPWPTEPGEAVPEDPIRRAAQVAVLVIFLAIIWLPVIAMTAIGTLVPEEAAIAATPPGAGPWARLLAYRTYFQESFGFRDALIRLDALVKVRLLGTSTSPKVLLGKGSWLFYADDGERSCFRHAAPFTAADLGAWKRLVESRQAWLSRQGVTYLLVLAPDKHTIYPENMGAPEPEYFGRSRLDQLVAALDGGSVRVLDLRPAFMRAKQGHELYFRTDTHFNDRGTWLQYRGIMEALLPAHPELHPLEDRDVRFRTEPDSGLDLARYLGLSVDFEEARPVLEVLAPRPVSYHTARRPPVDWMKGDNPSVPFVTSTCERGEIESALFTQDSFLKAVPLLAPHFRRASFHWQHRLDGDDVRKERPRVVIQEMVERALQKPMPEDVNVPWGRDAR